jgi:hypothetical protein
MKAAASKGRAPSAQAQLRFRRGAASPRGRLPLRRPNLQQPAGEGRALRCDNADKRVEMTRQGVCMVGYHGSNSWMMLSKRMTAKRRDAKPPIHASSNTRNTTRLCSPEAFTSDAEFGVFAGREPADVLEAAILPVHTLTSAANKALTLFKLSAVRFSFD